MKILVSAIGFISGIITIWQAISSALKNESFVITPFMCVTFAITIICVLIVLIARSKKFRYWLYKWYSSVARRPNLKYYVEQKDTYYTYKSRTELCYQIRYDLVAQSDGFSSFLGKFRWSKPQSLEEFHVRCLSDHHSLVLGRDTTWNTYTVEFDPAPKGAKRTVDVLISELHDPDKQALPFSTSSIVEHMKKLKMTVKLEDGLKFNLDKVRFLVYDNGASSFPILEETYNRHKRGKIMYDPEQMQISIEENLPVYGYKYQLVWDFK